MFLESEKVWSFQKYFRVSQIVLRFPNSFAVSESDPKWFPILDAEVASRSGKQSGKQSRKIAKYSAC